jgi:carbon monoxide dehydrogenase subunit G
MGRERTSMPRTEFHRDLPVKATPPDSWAALVDVPRLVSWVSVIEDAVELEALSKYTAVLLDRLGPFKLRADLDVTVSDVEPGTSLKVRAVGEDRQVGSRLLVLASLLVRPDDHGSTIVVDGVYEVTGKVASMGSGTINKKAQKILDEFFGAASDELGTV